MSHTGKTPPSIGAIKEAHAPFHTSFHNMLLGKKTLTVGSANSSRRNSALETEATGEATPRDEPVVEERVDVAQSARDDSNEEEELAGNVGLHCNPRELQQPHLLLLLLCSQNVNRKALYRLMHRYENEYGRHNVARQWSNQRAGTIESLMAAVDAQRQFIRDQAAARRRLAARKKKGKALGLLGSVLESMSNKAVRVVHTYSNGGGFVSDRRAEMQVPFSAAADMSEVETALAEATDAARRHTIGPVPALTSFTGYASHLKMVQAGAGNSGATSPAKGTSPQQPSPPAPRFGLSNTAGSWHSSRDFTSTRPAAKKLTRAGSFDRIQAEATAQLSVEERGTDGSPTRRRRSIPPSAATFGMYMSARLRLLRAPDEDEAAAENADAASSDSDADEKVFVLHAPESFHNAPRSGSPAPSRMSEHSHPSHRRLRGHSVAEPNRRGSTAVGTPSSKHTGAERTGSTGSLVNRAAATSASAAAAGGGGGSTTTPTSRRTRPQRPSRAQRRPHASPPAARMRLIRAANDGDDSPARVGAAGGDGGLARPKPPPAGRSMNIWQTDGAQDGVDAFVNDVREGHG